MAIQAQFYSENFDGASQDLLVENACGPDNFCFVPQQQRQQQQLPLTTEFDQFHGFSHQKNLSFLVGNNNSNNIPFLPKMDMNDQQQQQSMDFSQSVSVHIEKQRLEFEQFIKLQNDRLRLAMQEQRNHQTSLLMKKYESKTLMLLKQKQQQITNAANRTIELQEYLKRIEIENQTWQRIAKEKEVMVASLNSTIQRLRESANAAEDAGSCCQIGDDEEENNWGIVCKCCNNRESCVVILPCRHLCSCRDCEVFLDCCPVCRMGKKASIEALIS